MDPLLSLGANLGVSGLFISIMYLIFRAQLNAEREEKAYYREKLFSLIGVVDRQTDIVGSLVEPVKRVSEQTMELDAAAQDEILSKMDELAAVIQSLHKGK